MCARMPCKDLGLWLSEQTRLQQASKRAARGRGGQQLSRAVAAACRQVRQHPRAAPQGALAQLARVSLSILGAGHSRTHNMGIKTFTDRQGRMFCLPARVSCCPTDGASCGRAQPWPQHSPNKGTFHNSYRYSFGF